MQLKAGQQQEETTTRGQQSAGPLQMKDWTEKKGVYVRKGGNGGIDGAF